MKTCILFVAACAALVASGSSNGPAAQSSGTSNTNIAAQIRANAARQIRAKTSAELACYVSTTTNGTGLARFDFKGNSGHFTICADKSVFETMWSGCGADKVYAYKDYVDLVGWKEGQADFPKGVSEFVGWDWTRRAVDAKKGGVVAFMEKGGRICAVRIVNVSDRDRGAAVDELRIEYRIY